MVPKKRKKVQKKTRKESQNKAQKMQNAHPVKTQLHESQKNLAQKRLRYKFPGQYVKILEYKAQKAKRTDFLQNIWRDLVAFPSKISAAKILRKTSIS
jgi:hypothetical protein